MIYDHMPVTPDTHIGFTSRQSICGGCIGPRFLKSIWKLAKREAPEYNDVRAITCRKCLENWEHFKKRHGIGEQRENAQNT